MDRIFKKILITGTEIHIYKYKKRRETREKILVSLKTKDKQNDSFRPSAFLNYRPMNSYLIIAEQFFVYRNKNLMLVV